MGNRPIIEGVLRWIEDAGLNGACFAWSEQRFVAVQAYCGDTLNVLAASRASLRQRACESRAGLAPCFRYPELDADTHSDVLILAFESQQSQLAHYLRHRRQDSTLSSNLRIDLQCAEDDARTGTATLLGWAAAQGHLKVCRWTAI